MGFLLPALTAAKIESEILSLLVFNSNMMQTQQH
jgi:hypothetical protein